MGKRPRRPAGRPRKADLKQVVWWLEDAEGVDGQPVKIRAYGVVVDMIRIGKTQETLYRCVRVTQHGRGGYLYGSGVGKRAKEITYAGNLYRRGPRVWRKNMEMVPEGATIAEARGCSCMCCVHIAGVEEN
jgi:hypothetical protein